MQHRVAVATAQYYGIIGNGRQHVFDLGAGGQMSEVRFFDTQDGLYDCSWNEANENQLVSACAAWRWGADQHPPAPCAGT